MNEWCTVRQDAGATMAPSIGAAAAAAVTACFLFPVPAGVSAPPPAVLTFAS